MGYCEWEGLPLQPPKGFSGAFKWDTYLATVDETAVPEALLPGTGAGMRMGTLAADAAASAGPVMVRPLPCLFGVCAR